jgi:hypothetical protein
MILLAILEDGRHSSLSLISVSVPQTALSRGTFYVGCELHELNTVTSFGRSYGIEFSSFEIFEGLLSGIV